MKAGEMKFVAAEKEGPHGLLLVVTDKEILGKTFEEGKVQLDLSKEFYQGGEKSREEIKKLIPAARHLHLTGREAVAMGVEMGLVSSRKILWVRGVPHAEAVGGG